MTAVSVATPYGVGRRKAVAPAVATPPLRRAIGTLREPNTWTVALLLATGLAVIARHPLAHLIGTEVDTPAVAVETPVLSPVAATSARTLPALTGGLSMPTHAPVDPFSPLVSANGALLSPKPMAVAAKPVTPSTPTTPATVTASCAGTLHRVSAGDTLWSLAATATRSANSDRVTVAWHRIYAANRGTLGADPALLRVGQRVCVPAGI